VINFVIGKSGAAGCTPVYKIISLVQKPAFIEGDKNFPHRAGEPFVQCKPFAFPVKACPYFFKLFCDDGMMLIFYFPCFFKEFFPPHFAAAFPLFF
jgi:hypothetical protein